MVSGLRGEHDPVNHEYTIFVLYLNFVSRGDKLSHVVSTVLGHSVMREILLRSLVFG